MRERMRPVHILRGRLWGHPLLRLLAVTLVAVVSFWFGGQRGEQDVAPFGVALPDSGEPVGICRGELEECRQQVVNLSKGAEIDAAVLAQARSDAARARARIARLEQEVTLYRSLIDGSVRTSGVSVHGLEISRVRTDSAYEYRYQLTLIQRADRQVEVQGFATITVLGAENGKARRLALPELTGKDADRRLPLRFVYFQTLEGGFSLPPGFQPQQIRVQAEIRAGRTQKTERTFDWIVLED